MINACFFARFACVVMATALALLGVRSTFLLFIITLLSAEVFLVELSFVEVFLVDVFSQLFFSEIFRGLEFDFCVFFVDFVGI